MPSRQVLHIPAPVSRAVSPGSAYCGTAATYRVADPDQMRRWVVEQIERGKASQFCPRCLGRMVEPVLTLSAKGRAANRRRNESLSPEERQTIAKHAVAVRWQRYRERQTDSGAASQGAPTNEAPRTTLVSG